MLMQVMQVENYDAFFPHHLKQPNNKTVMHIFFEKGKDINALVVTPVLKSSMIYTRMLFKIVSNKNWYCIKNNTEM